MEDSENRTDRKEQALPVAAASEDLRKPYEAPRLVKKRSVSRATLVTAMGPMASGLTMTG
ncbi:MAG: hypothetical protein ABJE95_03325 [Byssovorax sp.]